MTRALGALALLAVLTTSLIACGPFGGQSGGGLKVLASTTLLADLARNVAGDRATVESIAPAGAHVEEYEPKPTDARRVSEADVIILNGKHLDEWAEKLVETSKKQGARSVELAEGLPDIDKNPHMWFDVSLTQKYVEKIRDILIEADPQGREGYTSRASKYLGELKSLDSEIRQKVGQIPQARRKLVTSHDAFPYYAKAYGFEVVGFTKVQEGKEPSARDLAELIGKVRAANVPAVFVEEGSSPRLAEALAREAGVKNVVKGLPTDSLGEKPADTYIGLMRFVTDKFVGALR